MKKPLPILEPDATLKNADWVKQTKDIKVPKKPK